MTSQSQVDLKEQFMHVLAEAQKQELPPLDNNKPIEKRELVTRCIETLVDIASQMDSETKLDIFDELTESTPQYKRYWLIASLGGEMNTPEKKAATLEELNALSKRRSAHTLEERICENDLVFLKSFAPRPESRVETLKG